VRARTRPADEVKLPRRLSELVSINRLPFSVPAAWKLPAADVTGLKQIIRREVVPEGPVNVGRAISALALREPSAEVAEILSGFLNDEHEDATDRAVAAVSLRLVPLPAAREGLAGGLSTADDRVRIHAIASLGCIGDQQSLAALEQVGEPRTPAEELQLAFAKALIAHRLGLPGDYLRPRRGVRRTAGRDEELINLSLRQMRTKTIVAQRALLRGSDYGMPTSDDVGFALRAGEAYWMVFVNREMFDDSGLASLFHRRWITALLARWDNRTKSYGVQYVVLTEPIRRAVRIMVMRTDGEQFYSGRATSPDGVLTFDMRDVARRGTAPTTVQGRLTARGIELDLAIPFGKRVKQRKPAPVVQSH
jgi:hypothetical protein